MVSAIRNATIENGTIEICPKSHINGIVKQRWSDKKEKATQIIVDQKIVDKYKQIKLEMKLGDVLLIHIYFIDQEIIVQKNIRYSLVGMWNDTTSKKFYCTKTKFFV